MANVVTSPDSPYTSTFINPFSLTQTDIQLGLKSGVAGVVYDSTGGPVQAAVVQAVGSDQSRSGVFGTQGSRTVTTLTDSRGRYRLLLDAGQYDLEVAPRDGAPQPRWAASGVNVGATDQTLDIHLPPAARISGIVRDPNGMGIEDVEIHVYLVSDTGFSRLRGLSRSQDVGNYDVVLANPPMATGNPKGP
jgi:hypothetical protein